MSFRQRRRYCVFGCTNLGISSSPAILVQLEHNHCIQGVQTSDPPLQFKDTGSKSIAQQSFIDQFNPPSTSQTAKKDNKLSEYFIMKYKSAQKNVRLLKTQLRKTKKKVLNYKSRLSAMDKALWDNSALKKVTANMTLAAKILTGIQFRQRFEKA